MSTFCLKLLPSIPFFSDLPPKLYSLPEKNTEVRSLLRIKKDYQCSDFRRFTSSEVSGSLSLDDFSYHYGIVVSFDDLKSNVIGLHSILKQLCLVYETVYY